MYKFLIWSFVAVHLLVFFLIKAIASNSGDYGWGIGILFFSILIIIHVIYITLSIFYTFRTKNYLHAMTLTFVGLLPWIIMGGLIRGNGDILIFSAPYIVLLLWYRYKIKKSDLPEVKASYNKVYWIVFWIFCVIWVWLIVFKHGPSAIETQNKYSQQFQVDMEKLKQYNQ